MMAGTIRAVTILSSGPEGAASGSSWACRETFVAIIVTILPIIQPLIRKGASMIGLSVLFSRQTKSNGESHQLRSSEIDGSRFGTRKTRTQTHPLSVPQPTAWGSDEHILPKDSDGRSTHKDGNGGIIIAQEINVQSEAASVVEAREGPRDATTNDWGFKALAGTPQ
ncbi:hypothetical protein ACJ41O_011882 [Fusarium nematophilum]